MENTFLGNLIPKLSDNTIEWTSNDTKHFHIIIKILAENRHLLPLFLKSCSLYPTTRRNRC
jgi:hypothetical protein